MFTDYFFFKKRLYLYCELSLSMGLGLRANLSPAPFRELSITLWLGPLELSLELDF